MQRRDISKAIVGIAAVTGAAAISQKSQAQTCTTPCYAQTAAELAAGVTPTNTAYPSHVVCGYIHIGRYGGNFAGTPTSNYSDGAMVLAMAVANKIDLPIAFPQPNVGCVWSFQNPWVFTGSMRVIGLGGQVPIAFNVTGNAADCITGSSVNFQPEIRDLSITPYNGTTSTGRDVLVISAGNEPIIENVTISQSYRDAFAISVNGSNWSEKGTVRRLYCQSCGRHAVRLETDGTNGAFINEFIWEQLAVRGVSFIQSGGMAVYFTSTATGGASKISNHFFSKSQFDCQWPNSGGGTPNASPVLCDSGTVQNVIFTMGGWENTGSASAPGGGGPCVNVTGSGIWSGLTMIGVITNSWWGDRPPSTSIIRLFNVDYSFGNLNFYAPASFTNANGLAGTILALVNALSSPQTILNLSGNTTTNPAIDLEITRTGAASSTYGAGAAVGLVNSTVGTSARLQEYDGNLILFANGTEAVRATAAGGLQLSQSSNMYSGVGAPSSSFGMDGDFYFRTDGSTGAHLYFKTAGVWGGLV